MSSEKEAVTAVLAFMGGQTRGAYSVGGLAKYRADNFGKVPTSYNEVHVMERLSDGPRRTHLPSQTQQWRVLIRSVAEKYENAQEMRDRASDLHEATVVIGGQTYYIERSVSDDPIAPDSGWWSGTSEFTF